MVTLSTKIGSFNERPSLDNGFLFVFNLNCHLQSLRMGVLAAGKLVDNKIDWRGDSALEDGSVAKLDLSKGMYDAGDHMKFGFPMAFTATVLSWAILEYGGQMKAVDQLEPAQDSLKWITDFLINAHPKENVLYIQVTQLLQSSTPFNYLFLFTNQHGNVSI